MPSALATIGAITLVSVGAAGMYVWDRHPPVSLSIPIPILHPHIRLPDSLKVQRDNAKFMAGLAEADAKGCRFTMDLQSAKVRELAAAGTAAIAKAEEELAQTKGDVLHWRVAAAQLGAFKAPPAADACARWDATDRAVVQALK